jgi:hypothetical protein
MPVEPSLALLLRRGRGERRSGARDWEEFVAYAKANPGMLNYGMLGKGSASSPASMTGQ